MYACYTPIPAVSEGKRRGERRRITHSRDHLCTQHWTAVLFIIGAGPRGRTVCDWALGTQEIAALCNPTLVRLQMGTVQAADGNCASCIIWQWWGCRWALCRLHYLATVRLQAGNQQAALIGNGEAADGQWAGCRWALIRLHWWTVTLILLQSY